MLRGDLKAMVALDALLYCMLYVICARDDLPNRQHCESGPRGTTNQFIPCHDDGKLTPVGWALCPLLSVKWYLKSEL